MGTSAPGAAPRVGGRRAALAAGLVLTGVLLGACGGGDTTTTGSPAPAVPAAPTTTVAAADRTYCDTVARVQAEQSSPQAGQGGVTAASAATRRQLAGLVAAAPPELAADWRTVQRLTEQGLDSLAQTGGDPKKIDRAELATLQAQAGPAVEHIKTVTAQRCHVAFRPTP
ncbi:hypothetical protein [Actinomycetospora sp. TBRC 11914]|uniref:hypothetical protein n=1 Tax=Actinomycetospora sp. TBRC 11914 TaxID=2729387 RepID=UPI00145CAEBA|nr:hypothetical protein [Actinomycetospora sp. TBRC 11914]NMO91954.1 hypothetical protein [Actinomycetospora sp. TBRC 11914]